MADAPGQPRPDLGFRNPEPSRSAFSSCFAGLNGTAFALAGPGARAQEPARLGQRARLAMATRDVARLSAPARHSCKGGGRSAGPAGPRRRDAAAHDALDHGEAVRTVVFLGQQRVTSDTTFLDFVNLLQHRQIAFYWRAWADLHPEVGVEHKGGDRVSRMLETLAASGCRACARRMPGRRIPTLRCAGTSLGHQVNGVERLTGYLSDLLQAQSG